MNRRVFISPADIVKKKKIKQERALDEPLGTCPEYIVGGKIKKKERKKERLMIRQVCVR
jgi:hypothetical protein